MSHIPVMLKEVLETLSPKAGEVYVDGTFGAGGYSRAFLENADCTVIAIDRDPDAKNRAEDFKEEFGPRFIFIEGCFGDALELVTAAGFEKVDGFVLDVGVSSFQIDDAARGFSFRFEGPLDMRMSKDGKSAADIVNNYEERDLADLIWRYGDERRSRQIAARIVKEREETPIETTQHLAEIIRAVVPRSFKDKSDPATRTFQALRIAVNDELGELERALDAAEKLLNSGGRLVVVSFHSLEDGLVKTFLYERAGRSPSGSRHLPDAGPSKSQTFSLSPKKALKPSSSEEAQNPRARSAKLRGAIRLDQEGNA